MFHLDFEVLLDFEERVSLELFLANVRNLSSQSVLYHFYCFLVLGQQPAVVEPLVQKLLANFIFHNDEILNLDFGRSNNSLKQFNISLFAEDKSLELLNEFREDWELVLIVAILLDFLNGEENVALARTSVHCAIPFDN